MSGTAPQRQGNLFTPPRADLFAGQAEPVQAPRSDAPTPDEIRNHLSHILD